MSETCWQCGGGGGFHDCGEDTCCCLDPDAGLGRVCDICGGDGMLKIAKDEE